MTLIWFCQKHSLALPASSRQNPASGSVFCVSEQMGNNFQLDFTLQMIYWSAVAALIKLGRDNEAQFNLASVNGLYQMEEKTERSGMFLK